MAQTHENLFAFAFSYLTPRSFVERKKERKRERKKERVRERKRERKKERKRERKKERRKSLKAPIWIMNLIRKRRRRGKKKSSWVRRKKIPTPCKRILSHDKRKKKYFFSEFEFAIEWKKRNNKKATFAALHLLHCDHSNNVIQI